MDVQIVLAEAVNNVIEHGFKDENSGEIHIDIHVMDEMTVVQLMDNGTEFILSSKPASPVINKEVIDDLPEGGFGWFLINEITHSFELRRSQDMNKLTLNFH